VGNVLFLCVRAMLAAGYLLLKEQAQKCTIFQRECLLPLCENCSPHVCLPLKAVFLLSCALFPGRQAWQGQPRETVSRQTLRALAAEIAALARKANEPARGDECHRRTGGWLALDERSPLLTSVEHHPSSLTLRSSFAAPSAEPPLSLPASSGTSTGPRIPEPCRLSSSTEPKRLSRAEPEGSKGRALEQRYARESGLQPGSAAVCAFQRSSQHQQCQRGERAALQGRSITPKAQAASPDQANRRYPLCRIDPTIHPADC